MISLQRHNVNLHDSHSVPAEGTTLLRPLNVSYSITLWVSGTTPKLLARVEAFLGHSLNHRLATLWANGSIILYAPFRTMGKTFCCQSLGETTFLTECSQLVLDLFSEHHNESITEH